MLLCNCKLKKAVITSSYQLWRSLYRSLVATFSFGSKDCDEMESISQAVFVRSLEGESSLTLMLEFKGRTHRLLRSKEESLGKTLQRIALTAAKTEKGKKKKKSGHCSDEAASAPIEAHLLCGSDNSEIPEATSNSSAWVEGNVLAISDTRFVVKLNLPTVLSLKIPECIMTRSPVIPKVELEFASISSCAWVWRHCHPADHNSAIPMPTAAQPEQIQFPGATFLPNEIDLKSYPIVGHSFVYWPTHEDSNHRLLLECIPANSKGRIGLHTFAVTNPVQAAPTSTPIIRRHTLTPVHLIGPDQFRMVSYNILADPYASTMFAQRVLYPYCKPEALSIEYRQCLIVQELLGYHSDIMCLQEVGAKCYKQYLLPALEQKGYGGCFSEKSGQMTEGEAIIFNASRFSLLSSESVALREFLQHDLTCSDLHRALHAAPTVLQDLLGKHTIVLLAFLKCLDRPNHFLCVANTHLYFHPMADHIRLLQVEISLRYIKARLDRFLERVGEHSKVAVAFCGDFNSCPCIAAYNYMITGSVSKHHPDWMVYRMTEVPPCACANKPPVLGTEEGELSEEDPLKQQEQSVWMQEQPQQLPTTANDSFEGIDLKHGFHFKNACGTEQYTNYTAGYRGVLDYIFLDSDKLDVEKVISLPSHDEVTEFVALPSVYFPSDHLALVVDLKWKF